MPGYPTRLIRSSFGPKRIDPRPVEHPEQEVGAADYNAAFHQVAGMNLAIATRASLIARWDSGTSHFVVSHQEEAWNSEREQAHPALVRVGAGVYTYTFAATYLDEDDVAVTTELGAPRVTVHKVLTAYADRVVGFAWVDASSPLVVQIRLWDAAGTPEDAPFWLEVD